VERNDACASLYLVFFFFVCGIWLSSTSYVLVNLKADLLCNCLAIYEVTLDVSWKQCNTEKKFNLPVVRQSLTILAVTKLEFFFWFLNLLNYWPLGYDLNNK
jgi:hypothetical protein